ncbi:cytochrome P450 [Actinobacteria bacterium OV450]|nr:cytochrome P450 [Actinobacteria bacterium OV450]
MKSNGEARPYAFAAPQEDTDKSSATLDKRALVWTELSNGTSFWLVSGYNEAREALTNPHLSRAAAVQPGAVRLSLPLPSSSILGMDPPEHTRLRRLVTHAFTMRQAENLRPFIKEKADSLIREMLSAGPPVDLISAYCMPLALSVMCELVGVPFRDRQMFGTWADAIMNAKSSDNVMRLARHRLDSYLQELIQQRTRSEGGLIGTLVAARDQSERLTERELLTFTGMLVVAGYETTANQIATCMVRVMTQPHLNRALLDDHKVESIIEELLRLDSSLDLTTFRIAAENTHVGSTAIRRGEAVIVSLARCNRDGRTFSSPREFDWKRGGPRHLAFGHGVHRCIGAQLARVEIATALQSLVKFPGLHLVSPVSNIKWRNGSFLRGPAALSVAW